MRITCASLLGSILVTCTLLNGCGADSIDQNLSRKTSSTPLVSSESPVPVQANRGLTIDNQALKHPVNTLVQNDSPQDDCRPRTLSPALWSELDLNEYLLNYPGGKDISLEELAIKSKLLNFDCGIDKLCYAGQLCSPVRGKDWYILVAAQEWNSYMNVVYQAVGFAMTMMQGIIPSMIKDFFPDKHDDWAIIKAYLTFFAGCAKVHPTEGHISNTKWWMQLIQGQIGLSAGEANIMDYAIIPDPVNQHDKLSKTQDLIQNKLAQSSEEIISSAISTQQGIYGVLKDGDFLVDHVNCQSLVNLAASEQSAMKLSIQMNLLAAIWEKQKYFILRGSVSHLISHRKVLMDFDSLRTATLRPHFPSRTRVMEMEKTVHQKNETNCLTVDLITWFLTEKAWKCQSLNNQYEPEVWNSSKPIKINSQCSFNLAVCDLTAPDAKTRNFQELMV